MKRTGAQALLTTSSVIRHVAALWICFALAGCSRSEGSGWKLISELTDGLKVQFVEVAKEKVQLRATYDEAVASLCQGREICVVGFYQAGDRIPAKQGSRDFFTNGSGFKDYPTVVTWWSNRNSGMADFTHWDCERAGIVGAPHGALCGEGVREAYGAILAIAGRTAKAEACHWPADDGKAVVEKFLVSLKDVERSKQFRQDYDRFYKTVSNGRNDVKKCQRFRKKIEDDARQARAVLSSGRLTLP